MTFELTIHGDSPVELLAALQRLTTAPQEAAETSAKPKTTRKKENTNAPTPAPNADSAAITASSDAAALDKLRDLSRSLIIQGRSAEVRAVVAAAGAKNISSIPPERYTEVWEKLVELSQEVDESATD